MSGRNRTQGRAREYASGMASDLTTGVVALAGAVIGGGFTLSAQVTGDRRARHRAAWAEHKRTLAAARLVAMDLNRTLLRLDRMDAGDRRGYVELPRGAWVAHRALLAPQLQAKTLEALTDSYNEIIEWNEVLWAAFASNAPDSFHGSDQHRLDPNEAAVVLRDKRATLDASIKTAIKSLGAELDRRGALSERDLKHEAT
jgi:hypothetical protein